MTQVMSEAAIAVRHGLADSVQTCHTRAGFAPSAIHRQTQESSMTKKQKRDNGYYEERLKRDHPHIFADLKAGKYRSTSDALFAAGLKNPRTRLQEMKNAWTKASNRERSDFLKWLKASTPPTASVPPAPAPAVPSTHRTTAAPRPAAFDPDRRLLPASAARIKEIMRRRGLTSGEVTSELGFRNLNAALGRALHRNTQLQPDIMKAIERWLRDNEGI